MSGWGAASRGLADKAVHSAKWLWFELWNTASGLGVTGMAIDLRIPSISLTTPIGLMGQPHEYIWTPTTRCHSRFEILTTARRLAM